MPRIVRRHLVTTIAMAMLLIAATRPAGAQQGWAVGVSSLSPVNIPGGGAQVAFDSAGHGFAVWTQLYGEDGAVVLAQYDPAISAWRVPGMQLSPVGQDVQSPHVAVDGAGNALVVWVHEVADVYYLEGLRYSAATATWSAPVAIATVGIGGAGPDLAMTPAGDALVVWTAISSATPLAVSVQAARYVAATGQWSAAVTISTPGALAYLATVAVTPGGDGVAAWTRSPSVDTEVVEAARFTAASALWSAPVTLSGEATYAEDATVAVDTAGNAVAAWQRTNVVEVARSAAATSTWSPTLTVSTSLATGGPALVSDAAGNATALWHVMSGAVETTRFDAVSGVWRPTVTIPGTSAVGTPALAVDTAGNVVAFWPSRALIAGSGQGARYVRASDQWSTVQTIATSGSPDLVDMAADGVGNVHVVWHSSLNVPSVFTTRWSGAPRAPTVSSATRQGGDIVVHVVPPVTSEPAFAPTAYEYSLSTRPWVRVPLQSPIVLTAPMVGVWYIAVRAVNAAGGGAEAGISVEVPPDPPSHVAVVGVTGSRVTLAWQAPAGATSDYSYVVEGGIAPGQVLARLPTGSSASTFTFDAPTGIFRVRVRTAVYQFQSDPSNEVVLAVNAAARPSPPSHLLGLAAGSALALSWTTTFEGGPPAGAALIVAGPVSGIVPLGLTDTFEFAGVPAGTYTFQVVSTNAVGTSAPSNPVTLSFPGSCAGPPGPPLRLAAARSGRTLSLAWSAPEDGTAATTYLLFVSGAFDLTVPLNARTISAPVPPGGYTFQVAAANACGVGTATAPVTVVVP